MRKITLHRPKESFNKYCSYEILVGKKSLTKLKNGEEKIIEIPNGLDNESLKAKIQWCGSEKMELKNISENEKIIVSGNEFLNRYLPLFGALIPITGVLMFGYGRESTMNYYIGVGLLISILLYVILALTIGRNKWLRIEKK